MAELDARAAAAAAVNQILGRTWFAVVAGRPPTYLDKLRADGGPVMSPRLTPVDRVRYQG